MLRLMQYANGAASNRVNPPPTAPGKKHDAEIDCNDKFTALLDLASGVVSERLAPLRAEDGDAELRGRRLTFCPPACPSTPKGNCTVGIVTPFNGNSPVNHVL